MPTQYIFTALPRHVTPGTGGLVDLDLSLFVSPRLDPGVPLGTLANVSFPAGDNYTAWTQQWVLQAEFDGGPTLVSTRLGSVTPALWPLLFPETMPVRQFAYESLAHKQWVSFPLTRLHDQLRSLYATIAQVSPNSFPGVGSATASNVPELANLVDVLARIPRVARDLEATYGPHATDAQIAAVLGVAAQDAPLAIDYYRAYRFYNRHLLDAQIKPQDPPPDIPEVEFHQTTALLADYPAVLRALGFVLDVRVGVRASAIEAQGRVRLNVLDASGGVLSAGVSPWTAYTLDLENVRFLPTPVAGSDIEGGMLRLDDPDRFRLVQMDVDGGVLKTLQFASNMSNLKVLNQLKTPEQAVASLRSAGLAVARVARPEALIDSVDGQDEVNGAISTNTAAALAARPIYAGDVLRGYRLDVRVNDRWFSLCERHGTYTIGSGRGQVDLETEDEGYVKAASAVAESDQPDDLYAHEIIAQWDGWSLVAPRPGRTVSFDKDPDAPENQTLAVRDEPNAPHPDLDFVAEVRARPGSLPRLRFGQRYRLRARCVDLAGNSLPLSTPLAASITVGEHLYARHEPVQSPTLVYRYKQTEGEWIENLVIRSDRDVSASEYADLHAGRGYRETAERHVAPPKATQVLCEAHGAFDALWQGESQLTHRDSYLLALKEQGSFLDREVFVPASASYVQVQSELHHTPRTPSAERGAWPEARGDTLGAGVYVAIPGEEVLLPYLPDPMAASLVLQEKGTGKFWSKPYVGGWPSPQPFRLVLRAGSEVDSEPRIETEGATCDVYLPQATIWELRFSSGLDADALDHMAYWQDVQGHPAAMAAVRSGTHWMFSPQRTISFVHAVQRPLEDPVASAVPEANRGAGDTHVSVGGSVNVHGRSTGQVDVVAHWEDDIDELTRPGPRKVRGTGPVQTLLPAYGATQSSLNGRLELNDTKYHRVVFQAIGTTRYREYFPHDVWRDPDNIQVAESVFDEAGQFTKAAVHVLATERPVAPVIQHIVPTFHWTYSAQNTTSRRTGRGLRVYLERPWFSSGSGELLGVVLARGNVADPQWVSRWAQDPLSRNPAPQNALERGHFTNVAQSGLNLKAPEGAGNVDVAGFAVEYDPERKRWFADIQIETRSAYYPFLKLVFCRFQPRAIPGMHLSRAVQTQYIQVAPDRTSIATRDGSRAHVTLAGPTRDDTSAGGSVPAPQANLGNIAVEPPSTSPQDLAAPAQAVPERAAHHLVIARLEHRSGESDLSWFPVNEGVELVAHETQGHPGVITWRGAVSLTPIQGELSRYRIAVEEWELYPTDPEVAVADAPKKRPQSPQPGYGRAGRAATGRLVHVSHLGVPQKNTIDELIGN